jgi:hypothetical protein
MTTPNPMPKQNNESWEKDFYKEFVSPKWDGRVEPYFKDPIGDFGPVIAFIRSEITKAKEKSRQQTLEEAIAVIGEPEIIDRHTEKQVREVERLNEGNISAQEILEDIGYDFNIKNELRAELREKLLKLSKK